MQVAPAQRRAALLFPARQVEDRELQHDINELRRKESILSDVCFHICVDFERANEAKDVEQAVRQIHRMYPADETHQYDCYVYALFPHLNEMNENSLKTVWSNLAHLNNVVASYSDFHFVQQVYLYHDYSMQSLAIFLHDMIQADIPPQQLQAQRGEKGMVQEEWPPVFGTFNAAGITYPEQEVKQFLELKYVQQLLRFSLADLNPIPMEICAAEAQSILTHVPIQTERITLLEESFLDIDEQANNWKRVSDYWTETAEMQSQALGDIPREEWLLKVRQRMDVQYQSRFRNMGVDYFYQVQGKKTDTYCNVLLTIIEQSLEKTLLSHSFTPEAQKNIVRSIVNLLQQRVLEIQTLQETTQQSIRELETSVNTIRQRWDGMNFFSRIMGKDAGLLSAYTTAMSNLFTQKTVLLGCAFATKLLNELIPSVQGLSDRFDNSRRLCDGAIYSIQQMVSDADPHELLGKASQQQLDEALAALESDQSHFLAQYAHVVPILLNKPNPVDGEDLIARIQTQFDKSIEQYLNSSIQTGKLPPVINQEITERMKKMYADKGGMQGFVDVLKEHTQLDLELKEQIKADKYLLVTPALTEVGDIDHVLTDNKAHILMLHLQQGLRLTDLDGFSGQKMFIEPSLF